MFTHFDIMLLTTFFFFYCSITVVSSLQIFPMKLILLGDLEFLFEQNYPFETFFRCLIYDTCTCILKYSSFPLLKQEACSSLPPRPSVRGCIPWAYMAVWFSSVCFCCTTHRKLSRGQKATLCTVHRNLTRSMRKFIKEVFGFWNVIFNAKIYKIWFLLDVKDILWFIQMQSGKYNCSTTYLKTSET